MHVPLAHLVTKLRKAGNKRLLQFIFMFVFHRSKHKKFCQALSAKGKNTCVLLLEWPPGAAGADTKGLCRQACIRSMLLRL